MRKEISPSPPVVRDPLEVNYSIAAVGDKILLAPPLIIVGGGCECKGRIVALGIIYAANKSRGSLIKGFMDDYNALFA